MLFVLDVNYLVLDDSILLINNLEIQSNDSPSSYLKLFVIK